MKPHVRQMGVELIYWKPQEQRDDSQQVNVLSCLKPLKIQSGTVTTS